MTKYFREVLISSDSFTKPKSVTKVKEPMET